MRYAGLRGVGGGYARIRIAGQGAASTPSGQRQLGPAMTTELTAWPFVGRDALVHEISLRLTTNRSVILAGGAGSGKTSLAQKALRTLGSDALVLHIRGTAVVSRIPYGPMSFLLSELDEESLHHPILVLQALTRHLKVQAGDRRIVLFVDNIEDLDELSVMTITQLAAQGTVLLVAVCETLPEAPQEFLHLWRDGVLHRVDVGPMSLDETIQLLKAELHGPISRSAVQELWTISEGNPLYLRVLTREQVVTKNLIRRDGVWVLVAQPAARGEGLVEILANRHSRLTEDQRIVVELVALAGSLPLKLLLKIIGPTDIDTLQEHGSLLVGPAPDSIVRIPSSLIAEVVRGNVPPGRSCELRERLVDASSDLPYPPVDVVSFATWTMHCGAPLELSLAVRAAREANNRSDPQTALRLLAGVDPDTARADFICEEARALIATGRFTAAREAVERISVWADLPIAQWADLAVIKSNLARNDDGLSTSARNGLEHLCTRIGHCSATSMSGHELEELSEKAKVAEIELAVYEGRYADLAETLEAIYHDHSYPESFRLTVGGWLSEVWTMTGRQDDGVQLALGMAKLLSLQAPGQLTQLAGERLSKSLLIAGRWDEFSTLLTRRRGREALVDGAGAAADELVEGMLYAYCGRIDDALELLLPSLGQLRLRDTDGLLVLALAATAYTYSLRQDQRKVSTLLEEMNQYVGRCSWSVHRAARFFTVLASASITSPERAASKLLQQADEDQACGALSYELFLVSAAVRLGHHASAGRLATSAARVQGPFARLCLLYGQAMVSSNAEQLLEAARMAQAIGQHQWCRDAARSALVFAAAAAQPQHVQSAHRLIGSSAAVSSKRRDSGNPEQLTSREREIARRAAAGATNKGIAKDLSLSVRTIEGHLHQIYGKLKVSSRSELEKTMT